MKASWLAIWAVLTLLGTGIPANAAPLAAPGAGNWTTVGGNLANDRFSPLDQINRQTVKRLGGAWHIEFPVPTRTPPVVVDGVLYTNDGMSVYALDAKTGATVWKFMPTGSSPSRGGVALGAARAYVGLIDAHIVALDRKTGAVEWSTYIGNADPATLREGKSFGGPGLLDFDPRVGTVSNAPTVVNGVVASGLSGGDGGTRGKITGIDAASGKVLWTFWVIPSLGSPGAETWPTDGAALNRGGGAVWTPGAADPELGLIYYGTGNAVPMAGGETREGNNLYTSSVVALDLKTGARRWHFQLTHHDLWEMDVSTPMLLYDAVIKGHPRKALAALRTDGYLFLLDRVTGEPIIPVEERPVPQDARQRTSPTQPFPAGATRLGPDCVEAEIAAPGFKLGCHFDPPYFDRPDVLLPLITSRFAPMAFDPKSNLFFVTGNVTPWWYRRVENPFALVASIPAGMKEYGLYAAIDARTDRIVWQKRSPWGLARGSGMLATAGGLVFHIEGDGTVVADDTRTGKTLWTFQTGTLGAGPHSMSGGVPFASYAIAATQYIAVPMGKSLWAFRLDGPLNPLPAPPQPPNSYGFSGIVKSLPDDGSGTIGIGTLNASYFGADAGVFTDEFAFVPQRAKIRAGIALRWTNYGVQTHTIVSDDGTWTTGPIAPAQSVTTKIEKPGIYVFYAKEFPWARGQIVVHP